MKTIKNFVQKFFNWTNFYYGYQLVVSTSFLLFYAAFLYLYFILNDLSSIETIFFDNFFSIIFFTTFIVFVEIIDFLLKKNEIKKIFLSVLEPLHLSTYLLFFSSVLLFFFAYFYHNLLEKFIVEINKSNVLNIVFIIIICYLIINHHKPLGWLTWLKRFKWNNPPITLSEIYYPESGRYLKFILFNNKLLNNYKALNCIYDILMKNEDFLNFGYRKIIIITAIKERYEYQLHHNVLITNDTPFEVYYKHISSILKDHYSKGSTAGIDVFTRFDVLVWNMEHLNNNKLTVTADTTQKIKYKSTPPISKREYHTTSYIKPLKNTNKIRAKNFAALDIETIDIDGLQQPISISLTSSKESKFFLVDYSTLKKDVVTAVNNLWVQLFNYLERSPDVNFDTIFVHNLGGFDGIFIFKSLMIYYNPSQINTVIDNDNKFIIISLTLENRKFTFKDSLRIFNVSLQDLCVVFKVEGKPFEYKQSFNKMEMFKDKNMLNNFIVYSCQDSKALYKAILKAQKDIIKIHNVDITTIVSTSSLALKIFRKKYLKTNIPILKNNEDTFIRDSYFGGATDYYQAHVKNVYYYDVNSLYPHAMCNPMPYKILRKYENMDSVNLNNFFGFCLAEIHCPENILKPMLPVRYKGKTIFPNGVWTGTYFSEELKTMLPLGYKIKLIKGIEFNKINLFNEYVEHFYKIKLKAVGAERWISKLMLNCLYGVFGRKQELLTTVNIQNSDLEKYVSSHIVKNIIHINDNISTLLLIKNIKPHNLEDLNNDFKLNLEDKPTKVKTNVAIAAAVTAYARVHMLQFKLDKSAVYTDTDSIFTTKKLDSTLIGEELGMMKDELVQLNTLIIPEAYFLGIKQYGYWFIDSNGNRSEKSVFAGVHRDSLTFFEITKVFNGATLNKDIPVRFFKSLSGLNIKIKTTNTSICKQSDKLLINNNYIPITINRNTNRLNNNFKRLKNYVFKVLKNFRFLKS